MSISADVTIGRVNYEFTASATIAVGQDRRALFEEVWTPEGTFCVGQST